MKKFRSNSCACLPAKTSYPFAENINLVKPLSVESKGTGNLKRNDSPVSVNMVTPLNRPNFHDPLVTVLTGFNQVVVDKRFH